MNHEWNAYLHMSLSVLDKTTLVSKNKSKKKKIIMQCNTVTI